MKKSLLLSACSLIASLILAMGQMNLGVATEVLVHRQARAWETGDVMGIIRDFAPDAVFVAGGVTFQGVEAIKKAAEDYFRQFTETKVTIKRMIFDDFQGAVEWDWSDRNLKTGKISQAEDAIIFELQDNGKIIYWREYIEKVSKKS